MINESESKVKVKISNPFGIRIGFVIKVVTSNGFRYTGTVIELSDSFITIIDRNKSRVNINIARIELLEEVVSNE
jgi:hypothetical protein